MSKPTNNELIMRSLRFLLDRDRDNMRMQASQALASMPADISVDEAMNATNFRYRESGELIDELNDAIEEAESERRS